jgi:purine nucleosidase/pyrimidine-specific ribonucleoside hydrolase
MIKVWIDTDVGGDIDDALALLLAMSSKQLEIVGVSTVYENTLARARIAKTLLALGGKGDVPVYVGESTPLRATYVHTIPLDINRLPKTYEEDVFGNAVVEYNAVEALHKALNTYEEINVVTVGALTNIARLLEKYPEDSAKIKMLYVMGGAIKMNLNEFNFSCDPEAAEKVIQSNIPKKVVTLDVTFQCALRDEQIARLKNCKSELLKQVLRMSDLWGHGMILHDPLTLGVLLSDEFVQFAKGDIMVETEGHYSRGKCVDFCDFNWGRSGRDDLYLPISVKAAEFCEYFVDCVCALDAEIVKNA